MKLKDILAEVQKIQGAETAINEASKEAIRKKYNKDRSKGFALFKDGDKVGKSQAVTAIKQLKDENTLEARNKIIGAFMKSDITEFRKILNSDLSKEAVDYMTVLTIAHGGEKKLLAKAGADKKKFLTLALADIAGMSRISSADAEEAETK